MLQLLPGPQMVIPQPPLVQDSSLQVALAPSHARKQPALQEPMSHLLPSPHFWIEHPPPPSPWQDAK